MCHPLLWKFSRRYYKLQTEIPPSQVPLHNRYEAVQVKPNHGEDDGSSRLKVSPRWSQPTPCTKTASIKKNRQVTVIGDSLLRETEGPTCRLDPVLREVCCLPGAWVKDVKTSYSSTVLRLLYVADFSCRQRWSCTKKSKGNQERLQGLGMTG